MTERYEAIVRDLSGSIFTCQPDACKHDIQYGDADGEDNYKLDAYDGKMDALPPYRPSRITAPKTTE
jgi:hypothetical protein